MTTDTQKNGYVRPELVQFDDLSDVTAGIDNGSGMTQVEPPSLQLDDGPTED